MEKDIRVSLTLDTLGSVCPVPIIKTQEYIKRIKIGEVLEILSDDRGVLKDMIDWCKGNGHEFLGYKREDDRYRLYVRRLV